MLLTVGLSCTLLAGVANAEARSEGTSATYGLLAAQYHTKRMKLVRRAPARCSHNWTKYADCKALLSSRARLATTYQKKGQSLRANIRPSGGAPMNAILAAVGLPANCRKLYTYLLAGDRAEVAFQAGTISKRKLKAKLPTDERVIADLALRTYCR